MCPIVVFSRANLSTVNKTTKSIINSIAVYLYAVRDSTPKCLAETNPPLQLIQIKNLILFTALLDNGFNTDSIPNVILTFHSQFSYPCCKCLNTEKFIRLIHRHAQNERVTRFFYITAKILLKTSLTHNWGNPCLYFAVSTYVMIYWNSTHKQETYKITSLKVKD